MDIATVIEKLQLQPHPEGGYYREVYRAEEEITQSSLPNRFNGSRSYSTSIYFLVPAGMYSRLHRIKADETWHFYTGIPLEVIMIDSHGQLRSQILGPDLGKGQVFQFTVPHGYWFGSRPVGPKGYALVGCTVAPGFDFDDFEMGDPKALIEQFPKHAAIINELT